MLVDILKCANEKAEKFGLSFTKISDVSIPLEKLLQVMLAFIKDGNAAYTKKSCVLQYGHSIYKDFSLRIKDYLTTDSMLNIYLTYIKAETDKKANDGRNPIPYYLISFLGYYFKDYENLKINTNENLCKIFNKENIKIVYKQLKKITINYSNKYVEKYKEDYNRMIKQKIDIELLESIINPEG